MKTDILLTIRWMTVLTAVFAPFLMVGYTLLVVPGGLQALQNTDGVDWIWLILLGAMMLGTYYFLAVYLLDKEKDQREIPAAH